MIDKIKEGKIALLFISRNNYQLFDEIFFKHTTVDFSNYYIFNIDLNSSEEQKQKAQTVFAKHDIINIPVDRDDPNLLSAERDMELCIQYIEKNNLDVDWIMWFSHDCHLIGDDFLEKLEGKLRTNPRFEKEVGLIGFCDYNTVKVGSPIYGRGGLLDGIMNHPHKGWYENLPCEYEEAEYFVVECPQDNSVLFNRKLWKKFIKPDYDFVLFLWVEDISAQFGLNGICSITIPSLKMADLFREKSKFGVSRSTVGNSKFHGDDYKKKAWINYWFKKYSWSKRNRGQFKDAFSFYENSIQKKIFQWKVSDGPKSLDDLKEKE